MGCRLKWKYSRQHLSKWSVWVLCSGLNTCHCNNGTHRGIQVLLIGLSAMHSSMGMTFRKFILLGYSLTDLRNGSGNPTGSRQNPFGL